MLLPRACLTDHSLACLGRNQNFITLCSFILLLCRILKQLYYCKICFVVVVDDGKNNWDWHWSIFPLTRSHIWLCVTYFLNKQAASSIVMLAPPNLKAQKTSLYEKKQKINQSKEKLLQSLQCVECKILFWWVISLTDDHRERSILHAVGWW